MCLGLPGQIMTIEGNVAIVDCWGTIERVRLDILETPVAAGDFVVTHEGVAVRRIPEEEVLETLGMYELVLSEA
jgi:hydrogenase expression/formation protein HypC